MPKSDLFLSLMIKVAAVAMLYSMTTFGIQYYNSYRYIVDKCALTILVYFLYACSSGN